MSKKKRDERNRKKNFKHFFVGLFKPKKKYAKWFFAKFLFTLSALVIHYMLGMFINFVLKLRRFYKDGGDLGMGGDEFERIKNFFLPYFCFFGYLASDCPVIWSNLFQFSLDLLFIPFLCYTKPKISFVTFWQNSCMNNGPNRHDMK